MCNYSLWRSAPVVPQSPVRNPTAQIWGLTPEFKHEWSVCLMAVHIHEAAAVCFGGLIGGKGMAAMWRYTCKHLPDWTLNSMSGWWLSWLLTINIDPHQERVHTVQSQHENVRTFRSSYWQETRIDMAVIVHHLPEQWLNPMRLSSV